MIGIGNDLAHPAIQGAALGTIPAVFAGILPELALLMPTIYYTALTIFMIVDRLNHRKEKHHGDE